MSLWEKRDYPVLRHLADNPPHDGFVTTNWLSQQPHPVFHDLTEAEFHRSVETLADAGYITYTRQEREGGGGVWWQDFLVTGAGKQALGDWPQFDVIVNPETLTRLFERLGEIAPTEEEARNYQRTAGLIRRMGEAGVREIMTGALSVAARAALHLAAG